MKYTRLGDLLIDSGMITEDQLQEALKEQKNTHKRLGDMLIDMGVITERHLIDALRMQLGVDFIDLTATEIPAEMTRLVSKRLAKKYSVVPVRVEGDELYLAMVDPLNFMAIEEVKSASRKRVVPMIATQSAMDRAIAALYGTEGAKRAIRDMQKEVSDEAAEQQQFSSSITGADDSAAAPSIRLVDSIIERGVADHASDIHIEPQETEMVVRMRVDGLLHQTLVIPKELQNSVIARLKVISGMDVTERRVPQDGRSFVTVRMRDIDLRVSTLPTIHGEKVVLRILDRDTMPMTPEGLGFTGDNLEAYNRLITNRQGVVLIVGPTGSGKSSTLYTMIQRLNKETVNLVTLEDPVEYNIEGITQIQVSEKTGMTFSRGLRSILRQDPDVIAVGEIRDGETAQIAMRSAITGHLVLSTIHTSDALSTIDRLLDVGVEPYMISTALKGVISQRLVRRICPHCSEEYTPSPEELDLLGIDRMRTDVKLHRGRGCPECFDSGYRGRIAVAETLMITPALQEAIHHQADHDELRRLAKEAGFTSIRQNCRDMVLNGTTSAEEAFRTINATV